MDIKWKVALLTLLGFSTAACCGTKKASKSDDKAQQKIEDAVDDPKIMLMYGVPFPDGSVVKPLTDEAAEQIKEEIRKEKEAAKEAENKQK